MNPNSGRGRLAARYLVLAAMIAMMFSNVRAATPSERLSDTSRVDGVTVTFETIARGISSPIQMVEVPDDSGRLVVVNKVGRIYTVIDGQALETPFLDITEIVNAEHPESGLFSIAFHPDYAENGLFFVAFTHVDDTNAVWRFQVSADDPNGADPSSGITVLAVPNQAVAYHNGGGLLFGPDGYLYTTLGDDTSEENPQSLLSLHGKLLRIDPRTGPVAPGEPAYAIPPDNPFVERDDARPEIWAYGLRNPWRFSFDRETRDLYIADVGQVSWEEINFQPADSPGGANYGWAIMEGNHCFRPAEGCDPTSLVPPVAEYSHEEGCAVIGGYVYRGTASPALYGTYLFADLCSGSLWGLERDDQGTWHRELLADTDFGITSFAQDAAGEIYVTTFEEGAVRRIVAGQREPVDAPAFENTWARSDQLVANGAIARSWIWGPWETRAIEVEPYDQAPDGIRTVVYFDKARMEINDPGADQNSPWYVTTGLLVAEMIVGRVQVGDSRFELREPAQVNVAGDPDDAGSPTYASFQDLLHVPPLPFDQPIIQRIDRDGSVSQEASLASNGVTIARIDDATGHSIAEPFWEFMTSQSAIIVDGEQQDGALFPDPVYATGRPITEPYWTEVAVGGTEQFVLVQCFERRCLTYTPNNAEGWKVECGNVGQHYYQWRYTNDVRAIDSN
ncbi:MAG TPA: PQQ-dependent sugar dehydrogenase [Thermomicrobiales bacterium]|nr:PQQ-dependent sugar dehydrogenase [Thermomicrobiales bacterium]